MVTPMESAIQKIPDSLIYEMVNGSPIYYKGYRDYLNGDKQIEELMGSSILQSLIISRLVFCCNPNITVLQMANKLISSNPVSNYQA